LIYVIHITPNAFLPIKRLGHIVVYRNRSRHHNSGTALAPTIVEPLLPLL